MLLRSFSALLVTAFTKPLTIQASAVLDVAPARTLLPFTATRARYVALLASGSPTTFVFVAATCTLVKGSTSATFAGFTLLNKEDRTRQRQGRFQRDALPALQD